MEYEDWHTLAKGLVVNGDIIEFALHFQPRLDMYMRWMKPVLPQDCFYLPYRFTEHILVRFAFSFGQGYPIGVDAVALFEYFIQFDVRASLSFALSHPQIIDTNYLRLGQILLIL